MILKLNLKKTILMGTLLFSSLIAAPNAQALVSLMGGPAAWAGIVIGAAVMGGGLTATGLSGKIKNKKVSITTRVLGIIATVIGALVLDDGKVQVNLNEINVHDSELVDFFADNGVSRSDLETYNDERDLYSTALQSAMFVEGSTQALPQDQAARKLADAARDADISPATMRVSALIGQALIQ